MRSVDLLIFFFFHAEDGIRDAVVSGFLSCVLPICIERFFSLFSFFFFFFAPLFRYGFSFGSRDQIGRASCRERV